MLGFILGCAVGCTVGAVASSEIKAFAARMKTWVKGFTGE